MAVIPVKIPLWDGNDTTELEGQRTFNSIDEEIALTYVTGVNQCAEMTSATAPSGTVIASSEFNAGYAKWRAFDRAGGASCWNSLASDGTGWIGYLFDTSKVITAYTITAPDTTETYPGSPMDWKFQGSNDGSNWSDLDTVTGEDNWSNGEKRQYVTTNTTSYTYYRINCTANGTHDYLHIDEIEFLDNPSGYSEDSPSPTEVWQGLPAGSVVDMSTIRVPVNMNSGDAGTIKFKYAANNGALNGTWLTQASLQSESDITVTDSTNSFKIVPQYISDGTQKSTSQAFAVVDVDISSGGSDCDQTSSAVLDIHRGLIFKANDANQSSRVDIDAYEIVLQNDSNTVYIATSVNLTADITASGVNGLDTGSESASTWYHVWVIYNGTTVASLISLSATNPTLPSGYTYKAYIGAICNNGSSTTYRTFVGK